MDDIIYDENMEMEEIGEPAQERFFTDEYDNIIFPKDHGDQLIGDQPPPGDQLIPLRIKLLGGMIDS